MDGEHHRSSADMQLLFRIARKGSPADPPESTIGRIDQRSRRLIVDAPGGSDAPLNRQRAVSSPKRSGVWMASAATPRAVVRWSTMSAVPR